MSGKILVVDDVATNRIVMKVKLAAACYTVLQAASGAEALRLAQEELPDLILLDVMMPGQDGYDICRALRQCPRTAHIPIIFVTSLSDSQAKLHGLRSGADDFLSKPVDETALLARVRSLLRSQSSAAERSIARDSARALGFAEPSAAPFLMDDTGSIGIMLADPAASADLTRKLSPLLADELRTLSVETALEASKGQPDVFVIGADQPGRLTGMQVLTELRARPATRNAGFVFLAPSGARNLCVRALDMGADEAISLSVHAPELALRLRGQVRRKLQRDRAQNQLFDGLKLATIDPLTGVHNRRYAMAQLNRISQEARHAENSFAVLIADFDHFKKINDDFGHAAGDAVLQSAARSLQNNLRPCDLIARIGGEEFLIVLPGTTAAQARQVAERLRAGIEHLRIEVPPGTSLRTTISLGITMGGASGRDLDPQGLMSVADQALFSAKKAGRNVVHTLPRRPAA